MWNASLELYYVTNVRWFSKIMLPIYGTLAPTVCAGSHCSAPLLTLGIAHLIKFCTDLVCIVLYRCVYARVCLSLYFLEQF